MKLRDESRQAVDWYVLDATRTKEELHAEIHSIALKVIEAAQERPLTKLWDCRRE